MKSIQPLGSDDDVDSWILSAEEKEFALQLWVDIEQSVAGSFYRLTVVDKNVLKAVLNALSLASTLGERAETFLAESQ